MKTNLTIKNFRIFDEDGVSIEINPITILTGCNGSGKSSIVKAVLLLNSFLSQIKNRIDNEEVIKGLGNIRLIFTSDPFKSLGRFEKTIHNGSDSHVISFEYTVYSDILSEDVSVFLSFCADDNDALNNGFLKTLRLSTERGVFYESSRNTFPYHNFNIVKDECLNFILLGDLIWQHCCTAGGYFYGTDTTVEQYNEIIPYLKAELAKHDSNRVIDVQSFIKRHGSISQIIGKEGLDRRIIEWTRQNKSYFMIPVITLLNTVKKSDFNDFLEKHFLSNLSEKAVLASRKVIDSFILSEFDTFGDYFINMETSWFGHIDRVEIPFFLSSYNEDEISVLLPNPQGMHIPQNYLFDAESISLFEEKTDDNNGERNEELDGMENAPVSFPMAYELVMYWNESYDNKNNNDTSVYYHKSDKEDGIPIYYHTLFTILSRCFYHLILEALSPEWVNSISYAPSARVIVSRLYPLEVNDTFSNMLKSYFERKRIHKLKSSSTKDNYEEGSFLNKWVQSFLGEGKSITLDVDREGLGVQIRLHHSEDDIHGSLLADEGFGVTQLLALLLQIEIAILSNEPRESYDYVGLPDPFPEKNKPTPDAYQTIAIEEPEIHLHPAYQSKLADMLVDAYLNYNLHFIIETHSEYLIRKLQLYVPDNNQEYRINSEDVSILYINAPNRNNDEGEPLVKHIHICKDGYLDDTFGSGFYDEATSLSRKLM